MTKDSFHPWRQALKEAITDPAILLAELQLSDKWLEPAKKAARVFPLRVPKEYLIRIEKGNPFDPLLRQVLPLAEEFQEVSGFASDPLSENKASPIPGLLHKYLGRVLLIMTGACAVNCRYCFRRQFPYSEHVLREENWKAVLSYLAEHTEVEEVILSGGDPLILSDSMLSQKVQEMAQISHIKRLRIHSRVPVVIPSRVTDEMIHWLTESRLKPVMVIHANHPNELDEPVEVACSKLVKASVPLFNQSVLLKGVNDKSETLVALSKRLFESGVIPYYLHLLDRVQGAAHFEVPEQKAKELWNEVRQKLPGYLVPKWVREKPEALSKEIIFGSSPY